MPLATERRNHNIQTATAINKLRTPLDRWVSRDGVIEYESLQLAAGQLALCLSTPPGEAPTLLDDIIEEYEEVGKSDWFQLDLILPSEALAFLPAAERIVAMTRTLPPIRQ